MSGKSAPSSVTERANSERLRRLRVAIDNEGPVDGIHNPDVAGLYSEGGPCPRYLGCASEGHWDSSYRDNPDFYAGEPNDLSEWLAASYEEGWAGRWVLDLETGDHVGWTTSVKLGGGSNGR